MMAMAPPDSAGAPRPFSVARAAQHPRLHLAINPQSSEDSLSSLQTRSRRSVQHLRSQSIPVITSLVSPNFSSSSVDSTAYRSPSALKGKRAHLIQEICETERSYARDLALVRDAYLYRIRPDSTHSTVSQGETSDVHSPVTFGPGSRVSVYTYETAETRRSSVSDGLEAGNGGTKASTPTTPDVLSPPGVKLESRTSGYFGDSPGHHAMPPPSAYVHRVDSTGSNPTAAVPLPSSRTSSLPPTAATISPADVKAVFLNLEQLAAFSDDLASAFEAAAGGSGTGHDQLDAATPDDWVGPSQDRLGKAFLAAVSVAR
jgi:hypothetical protein